MKVEARKATPDDIAVLEHLYRSLEKEMTALHPMWPLADGLEEPVTESLLGEVSDPESVVLVAEIDGYPFGFLVARYERINPQAGDVVVGAIRLIYVDDEAREVALGEAMREEAMAIMRARGVTRFDAHVLPGHRLAKNFFEAGGFAARSIVMHHDDAND